MSFARYRNFREYQPIVTAEEETPVFRFHNGHDATDCQLWHLLYEPMTVLILFSDGQVREKGHIVIYPQQNQSATIAVQWVESINFNNQMLAFYKVLKADLSLAGWQHWYLKRIFRHSVRKGSNFMAVYNFDVYRKLVALFSFPKQVRLVSVRIDGSEAHFPIDLCAVLDHLVVLGVRNSNQNMNRLQIGDTFYLGDATADGYNDIYALGKFAEKVKSPAMIDVGGFKIPAVISSYRKLTLQQTLPFERQTLYFASVEDPVVVNQAASLFHIHKIWLTKNLNYTTVA